MYHFITKLNIKKHQIITKKNKFKLKELIPNKALIYSLDCRFNVQQVLWKLPQSILLNKIFPLFLKDAIESKIYLQYTNQLIIHIYKQYSYIFFVLK